MERWTLEWKPHLVRCVIVCLNNWKKGLSVKCLSTLNKALCKWNWCFAKGPFGIKLLVRSMGKKAGGGFLSK